MISYEEIFNQLLIKFFKLIILNSYDNAVLRSGTYHYQVKKNWLSYVSNWRYWIRMSKNLKNFLLMTFLHWVYILHSHLFLYQKNKNMYISIQNCVFWHNLLLHMTNHWTEKWDQWTCLQCRELLDLPSDDWIRILPLPYTAVLETKAHARMITELQISSFGSFLQHRL